MNKKNNCRKDITQEENPYHIFYENYLNTNACTECTGLMPNGIDGHTEWDIYREIFNFIPVPSEEENDQR